MRTASFTLRPAAIAVTLMISACASGSLEDATVTNVSPEQDIPDTSDIAPIPAVAVVRSTSDEDLTDNDLVTELKFQRAFETVLSGRGAEASGPVEIVVRSDTQASDDIGEAIGQGLASGLTFGIAGQFQDDDSWYQVTLDADVSVRGRPIGRYQTIGRIETAIPDRVSLPVKQELAVKRVNLAFEHALGLLVAKIKQDHAAIEAAL